MKKTNVMILLAGAVLLTTSCSKKKEEVKNIVAVKTTTASQTASADGPSYAGTIEEVNGTSLSFAGAGTIKTLNISEGQYVLAGQVLGTIDASTSANALAMTQAATQQARESMKQAEDAYKRMKQLHDNGSLLEIKWVDVETKVAQARQMVAQAEAAEKIAQKGMSDTRLIAPFSGFITQRNGEIGQNVLPGQPVARLVKIDKVKVKISVPETEVSNIRSGQRITFKVASLGDKTFSGTVSEKSVAADIISRAYTVKAIVQNESHELLPGMVCDVFGTGSQTMAALSLPENIIQIDCDNKPFVWTVADGKVKKQYVTLGENIGENVAIASGLTATDRIIVEGQQKVSNGQQVKVIK